MAHPKSFDATPETFDSLVLEPRGELVLVDFWGPDCPNCEVFAAAEPALLAELGDVPMRIVKVNAYAYEDLAKRFGLFGIPTFFLFRDGKQLGRMAQYYGREYFLGVIRDHLPGGQKGPPLQAAAAT
jgi:thiol-disulfide isomerase/thioredoxin